MTTLAAPKKRAGKWCSWGGTEGFGITSKYFMCWGCGKRVKYRRPLRISRGTWRGKYRAHIVPAHKRPRR